MKETKPQNPLAANISTVVKMEQRFLEDRTAVERIGDAVGTFAGSMAFVVLHMVVFGLWFLVNTKAVSGVPKFDPYPYVLLSMVVSVEAVLLSTFVLMKQNREGKRAEQRQHLTLQIDLLTEQETTKSLQLLQRICENLGIENVTSDREIKVLSQDTVVDKLADELKSRLPTD